MSLGLELMELALRVGGGGGRKVQGGNRSCGEEGGEQKTRQEKEKERERG